MSQTLATLEPTATQDITALQARAVIDSAIIKASELGAKMDIAVVDAGSNLKSFLRMDGAWLGSIDIAIKKARTARLSDSMSMGPCSVSMIRKSIPACPSDSTIGIDGMMLNGPTTTSPA